MVSPLRERPRKAASKPDWPRRVVSMAGRRTVEVMVYRRSRKGDGRVVFEVADYSEGRRRLRGFNVEADALAEAQRIADLLAKGQDFAAGFTAEQRASLGRALVLLQPTGDTLELAASRYAEAVELLGGRGCGSMLAEAVRYFVQQNPQNLPRILVAEAVEKFVASRLALGKSPRYVQDLESRLGRFGRDHVNIELSTMTPQLIGEWLDALVAKSRGGGGGLSVQSRENFRRVLSGLFEYAVGKGWLLKNPVARVERHDVGDRDVKIYRPEEFVALLSAASPDFVPFLVLGGFCGIRSAEIERLTWRDVDLVEGHVLISASIAKVRSRRVVPLPACAVAWLTPLAGNEGPIWPHGHFDLHRWQTDTATRAGVTWIPNGLRHSAASYLLAQHGDAGRVAGWLGNSADVVHRHYKALATEGTAKAWFSIKPTSPKGVVAFPGGVPAKEEAEPATATG